MRIDNPLVPRRHKSVRIAKISILKLEGIIKKFPMTVATMSRQTKNDEKMNSGTI